MAEANPENVRDYLLNLQDRISTEIEQADGHSRFREDRWDRPEGGGGRSRVLENGAVFEKEDAAENLCAAAHLGALPTKPNLFCNCRSFIL